MAATKLKRSPEALTMSMLVAHGWVPEKCSWWEPYSRRRKDLFGFADLIGMSPAGLLLVQACAASDMSTRLKKIQANPKAQMWLEVGNQIWVVGWRRTLRQPHEYKIYKLFVSGDKIFAHHGDWKQEKV